MAPCCTTEHLFLATRDRARFLHLSRPRDEPISVELVGFHLLADGTRPGKHTKSYGKWPIYREFSP